MAAGGAPVRVLVVDDSPVAREFLGHILSRDPALQIIGTARDGLEAVAAVRDLRPDVVVMDVLMPNMDGLEATRRIMTTSPTPIVIVTAGLDSSELQMTFRAMAAGALAALEKPVGMGSPGHDRLTAELAQTVRLMAEVKVVRRREAPAEPAGGVAAGERALPRSPAPAVRLVLIGASTGGPNAIKVILSGLPEDFPAPLLVVQHITEGFVHGFAEWLDGACPLAVKVATPNELPLPGHVYVAPDRLHMGLGRNGRLALSDAEPEAGLRPSVSYLFRSVAETTPKGTVAVLLTGMGRDGARELRLLKDRGAFTIAQDGESAVVNGMPGEAVTLGAASLVMPPARISSFLAGLHVSAPPPGSGAARPDAKGRP